MLARCCRASLLSVVRLRDPRKCERKTVKETLLRSCKLFKFATNVPPGT